jgi:tetratricopeptide (TPR) repeat protein
MKEGADPETVRRAQAAADILNRGTELDDGGRWNEACAAYDQIVGEFGGVGDPFRSLAVEASISKWLMLRRLDQPEAARTAFDEIQRFEPSMEDEPKAYAGHVRTLRKGADRLRKRGAPDQAILAYDDLLARFNDRPGIAKEVAFVLLDKGLALSRTGRPVEIISLADETTKRFEGDEDDRIRTVVGLLLSLKGSALAQVGRNNEALDAVELFLKLYDGDLEDVQAMVPRMLLLRGAVLGELARNEDAVKAYEIVVQRFGDSDDVTLRDHVADALVGIARVMFKAGSFDESLRAYDDVLTRSRGAGPELNPQAAAASLGKAASLSRLGRMEDALDTYDETITSYASDFSPAVRRTVIWATLSKVGALAALGRYDECQETLELAISTYEDELPPVMSEWLTQSLIDGVFPIGVLAESEEEAHRLQALLGDGAPSERRRRLAEGLGIGGLEELLERFPDDPRAGLRACLSGLVAAETISDIERTEDEALNELTTHFGDVPSLAMSEWAVGALVERGTRLGEAGRTEEAIRIFDTALASYGAHPAPEVRRYTAAALLGKGVALARAGRSE